MSAKQNIGKMRMPKDAEYWRRWNHFQQHGQWPKSNKNVSKAQSIQGNVSMNDEVPNRAVKKTKASATPEDPYYGKPKDTPSDGMLF